MTRLEIILHELSLYNHYDVLTAVMQSNNLVQLQYNQLNSIYDKQRIRTATVERKFTELFDYLSITFNVERYKTHALLVLSLFDVTVMCAFCKQIRDDIRINLYTRSIKINRISCDSNDCNKSKNLSDELIQFLGYEICSRLYNTTLTETGSKNNIEGFVKRYGKELGHEKYREYTASGNTNLEGFIQRHGHELGNIKYTEFCNRIGNSKTKMILRCKGDKELAYAKFKRYRTKNGTSLENFIQRHGQEIGTQKYHDNCSKIGMSLAKCIKRANGNVIDGMHAYHTFWKSHNWVNVSSVEANNFFETVVIPLLPDNLKYQYDKNEKKIGLTKQQMIEFKDLHGYYRIAFSYDFCCKSLKLIIDYHGTAWHYHPDYNMIHSDYAEHSKLIDRYRKELAESKGYRYVVVYSHQAWTDSKKLELQNIISEQCQSIA